MPRYNTDYSKLVIYKIVCEDSNVKDIYVGHTTDFDNRKHVHKVDSRKKLKLKLYQVINANGGWENWRMVLIEKYQCNDKLEAGEREYYWFKKLNANLNSRNPKDQDELHRQKQMKYREPKYKSDLILKEIIKHHVFLCLLKKNGALL